MKARGGRRSVSTNNGGVMGSGVYGMLGTTIHCQNSDNSYYCTFMKMIQVTMSLFIILAILYFVYSFLMKKK